MNSVQRACVKDQVASLRVHVLPMGLVEKLVKKRVSKLAFAQLEGFYLGDVTVVNHVRIP